MNKGCFKLKALNELNNAVSEGRWGLPVTTRQDILQNQITTTNMNYDKNSLSTFFNKQLITRQNSNP